MSGGRIAQIVRSTYCASIDQLKNFFLTVKDSQNILVILNHSNYLSAYRETWYSDLKIYGGLDKIEAL